MLNIKCDVCLHKRNFFLTISRPNTCMKCTRSVYSPAECTHVKVPQLSFHLYQNRNVLADPTITSQYHNLQKSLHAALKLLHSKRWVTRPNMAECTGTTCFWESAKKIICFFLSRNRPFYSLLIRIVVSLCVENFV